jgi:hypothetical protein
LIGEVEGDISDDGFVAVADDGVDFREGGEFLWCALGVATGNDDPCIRTLAADTADEGASLAVGFGCYAAGIYNNDMGCAGIFSGA